MFEKVKLTEDDIGTITVIEKPKPISKHVVKRLDEKRIVDMGGNATIGPAPQGKDDDTE